MKTTYRTTHISKPHSRAERALTLAVLTALLSGAAATPAMARDRTIAEDETVTVTNATRETNHRACLTYSATEKSPTRTTSRTAPPATRSPFLVRWMPA